MRFSVGGAVLAAAIGGLACESRTLPSDPVVSVWSVDADGNASGIGCGQPLPSYDPAGFVMTAAVTPDAVYVVAGTAAPPTENAYFDYALVRLDRAAATPFAP